MSIGHILIVFAAGSAVPSDTSQMLLSMHRLTGQAEAKAQIANKGQASPDALAELDEATGQLLMDALRLRKLLSEGGEEGQRRGNEFWSAVSAFAETISAADDTDKLKFLPIVQGIDATLAEDVLTGTSLDQDAVLALQRSLEEQVAIQTAPAAFPGAKAKIKVDVRALRGGTPVNGLYVWLDLACCVRTSTAYPAPNVTSPATAEVIPGTYVVRLRQGDQTLASRRVLIGATSRNERVDVVLP